MYQQLETVNRLKDLFFSRQYQVQPLRYVATKA